MRIPGSDRAYVDAAKVRDYLLSSEHPVGRFKARVFAGLGYSRDTWHQLQFELQALPSQHDAERTEQTEFGDRYEIRAQLRGPNGQERLFVTAWFVRAGEDVPRFVTAFPSR